MYVETSALEATNVEQAFQHILTKVYYIVHKKAWSSEEAMQVRGTANMHRRCELARF